MYGAIVAETGTGMTSGIGDVQISPSKQGAAVMAAIACAQRDAASVGTDAARIVEAVGRAHSEIASSTFNALRCVCDGCDSPCGLQADIASSLDLRLAQSQVATAADKLHPLTAVQCGTLVADGQGSKPSLPVAVTTAPLRAIQRAAACNVEVQVVSGKTLIIIEL